MHALLLDANAHLQMCQDSVRHSVTWCTTCPREARRSNTLVTNKNWDRLSAFFSYEKDFL
jgi:hypothetical protein